MENLRPRPTPIKNDVLSLGATAGLAHAFEQSGHQGSPNIFQERARTKAGAILDRVEAFPHQIPLLVSALQDVQQESPTLHELILGALLEVETERLAKGDTAVPV